MRASARLTDLPRIHPRLLWNEAILAAAGLLPQRRTTWQVELSGISSATDRELALTVDASGVSKSSIQRLQRTYEPARRVEVAAVAVAGLAVYHGMALEIRNVALRATGGDYLVGDEEWPLEIAGRSRASDLSAAWNERWERLTNRQRGRFGVCVVEFQTLTARLGIRD